MQESVADHRSGVPVTFTASEAMPPARSILASRLLHHRGFDHFSPLWHRRRDAPTVDAGRLSWRDSYSA